MSIHRSGRRILLCVTFVCVSGSTGRSFARAASTPTPDALPKFTDVTEAAGIAFQHSVGDDTMDNLVESSGSGCGFFDYDGDGLLDIYFVSACYRRGLSDIRGRRLIGKTGNKLYRNKGDGTFENVTDRAGVGDRDGHGMGCTAADYDNDGDVDLYVTNYGSNTLFRNNGDGTFTDVAGQAGVADDLFGIGCAWFDYDGDGNLDLYSANYVEYDRKHRYQYAAGHFAGPLAYDGRADVLYRNNGDGTFADVTRACGVYSPAGRAMGVSVCDFDGDGDTDLFVANDEMANYFFRNNGNGTFTDIALESGVALGTRGNGTSGMGPVFGDVNGDGHIDLFVPDMRECCLYVSAGDGTFEDRTSRSRMSEAFMHYTHWSGSLFDYDNDGAADALTTNGGARWPEG